MNSGDCRRIDAPPFSDGRIIREAEELTRGYVRATNPDPVIPLSINFDHIYEHYIYPNYGIVLEEDCDLGRDERGKKILGVFDFETNTACIDASLGPQSRDPRRIFTCWHEVGGHGILQGDWLRREWGRFRDSRAVVTTEESIDGRTISQLERQANLFAAHAAAPTWFLRQVLRETYGFDRAIRYLGPGNYTLIVNERTVPGKVEDFNDLCRIVAYYIGWRFGGLSNEALGYRVKEVDFVVDASRPGLRLNRVARAPTRLSRGSPVLALAGSRLLTATAPEPAV